MKYLESAKLEALNSALSVESGDCRLDVRLESYSCKMVQTDKRQWKRTFQPGTSPRDLQPLSPPVVDDPWAFQNPSPNAPGSGCTPGLLEAHTRARHRSDHSFSGSDDEGPVLRDSISRRTLFDLIAVLNTSFSDYDFSDAKSDTFSLVPTLEMLVNSVDAKMAAMVATYNRMRTGVWRTIDEEIKLSECKMYSYNPDYSSDPFCEDGCVWSFNYFFYNKHKKRILFFSCRALRDQTLMDMSDEQMWSLDEQQN